MGGKRGERGWIEGIYYLGFSEMSDKFCCLWTVYYVGCRKKCVRYSLGWKKIHKKLKLNFQIHVKDLYPQYLNRPCWTQYRWMVCVWKCEGSCCSSVISERSWNEKRMQERLGLRRKVQEWGRGWTTNRQLAHSTANLPGKNPTMKHTDTSLSLFSEPH